MKSTNDNNATSGDDEMKDNTTSTIINTSNVSNMTSASNKSDTNTSRGNNASVMMNGVAVSWSSINGVMNSISSTKTDNTNDINDTEMEGNSMVTTAIGSSNNHNSGQGNNSSVVINGVAASWSTINGVINSTSNIGGHQGNVTGNSNDAGITNNYNTGNHQDSIVISREIKQL